MIGKILQNVVNGTEFKEPFMNPFNQFVKDNAELIISFMKNLARPPSANVAPEKLTKPYTVKEALKKLNNCLVQQKAEVLKRLKPYDTETYSKVKIFHFFYQLI